MVNTPHITFSLGDRSYLAIVKKGIHKLAAQANFSAKKIGEIDLVVAEMGSNLIKHAGGGEILAGLVKEDQETALELISIDNGPGIAEPEKIMKDGASSTQTLGTGLGSIKRLSDVFELYTKKDWGTIILSRINVKESAKKKQGRNRIHYRALVVAKPGETVSGDGTYAINSGDGMTRLLVADGLGHGEEANRAVTRAIQAFAGFESDSPAEILRHLHADIKKTRGLVGTIVIFDPFKKIWKLCGIGNISTRLSGYVESRSYIPYNGIVGHNIPNTLNDQELSQKDYQQIILCSDGIRSRWENARHPTIQKYDLVVQAAAIYKEFGRRTDDMSVVIGRIV